MGWLVEADNARAIEQGAGALLRARSNAAVVSLATVKSGPLNSKTSPSAPQSFILVKGLASVVEGRKYARSHETRILPGQNWFWADSRAEALDLASLNNISCAEHDRERDEELLEEWGKAIKKIDRGVDAAPAKTVVVAENAGASTNGRPRGRPPKLTAKPSLDRNASSLDKDSASVGSRKRTHSEAIERTRDASIVEGEFLGGSDDHPMTDDLYASDEDAVGDAVSALSQFRKVPQSACRHSSEEDTDSQPVSDDDDEGRDKPVTLDMFMKKRSSNTSAAKKASPIKAAGFKPTFKSTMAHIVERVRERIRSFFRIELRREGCWTRRL
ncbi:hypothetical protein MRB53_039815 [Persea americana]|nr:hypothetical protein MRB53_039815 [Persea americana]